MLLRLYALLAPAHDETDFTRPRSQPDDGFQIRTETITVSESSFLDMIKRIFGLMLCFILMNLFNDILNVIMPYTIMGIKHGFSCINIRQVPWEVLKTEAEGRGFQHLPRDLANVNALKNHVRSLLLHKNEKHLLHFALFLALFRFPFSTMSRERYFHGLCSF